MPSKLGFFSAVVLAGLMSAPLVCAQVESGAHARPRIIQGIDEIDRVGLPGNTHPDARPVHDRGPVAHAFAMEHMLLQLKRSPEQEAALQEYLDELHTIGSPNFHRWLSAQEFGERFGVAKPDLDAVTRWLESHGFRINVVYPSGMVIDFSGNAGQVKKVFDTEIHHFEVKGKWHVGNLNDPRIPAALAPVIAGVVSLHDFRPHALYKMHKAQTQFTFPDGFGGNSYAVVPADLATIYNLNPVFSAGVTGQGETIVLIEDTDVFSAADWSTFRQTFGLSGYGSASFTQVHPPAPAPQANNCGAPGVVAPNDAEAILDAEWASAAAPSAAIEMAACADTSSTFGGLIAIQNLINASTPPPSIMSISYGQCETVNGAAANVAYNSAYQQAVAEGVSVFVAAGDSGAAGCDNSVAEATHGIGVNAFASTPNNVAVGGTDFSDTYSGTNATYWNSSNASAFGSAISYIPETPWNDSCAGFLFSNFEGFSPTYGATSLCNDPSLGFFVLSTVAGGGGPSQCATGTPSTAGVVSGSCAGWPKPSWQAVLGNPHDGVRDTPDVSLFAADGLWSHYYVFCWSDTANGGAACGSDPSAWSGAGGTSFASPIMAGIQALINQKAGGPQGNPAPVYYQLAAAEYGASGSSACDSSKGSAVASSCVFYDVTFGDMDVDCVGPNCYLGGAPIGVLSTSNTAFSPAYGTTVGWDFATGIGTVNAANLVNNWSASSKPSFTLSTSAASLTFVQGAAGSTTITINPLNGFRGNVNLTASGLPSGVSAAFGTNPATTTSLLTLSATGTATIGTFPVTVTGTSGSLSSEATITVTVNPVGDFTLSASPNSLTVTQGTSGTSAVTVTPLSGFNNNVSLSASGLPNGVTASFSPNPATASSTLTLTASSTATTGTVTVTITGTSGNLSHITTIALAVTVLPNYAVSASPSSVTVTQGASGTSTVTVTPQNGFTGNVNLSASGLPTGVTASFSPNPATATSTVTLTASSTATTGTATVTITGSSGSLSHTTAISLTVQAVTILTLPSGWSDGDVGAVGVAGTANFASNVFTVKGAGAQIYGAADAFHFVYQPLSGDGTIVARLVSLQGGSGFVAAGVMIRETLNAASTNAKTADWAAYNAIYFDARTSTGGGTAEPGNVSATLPYWVKVSRSGSTFSSYASTDGVSWVQVGTNQTISMAQNVYVGLAVTSGSAAALATAAFDNVSVNTVAAPAPVISSVSATSGVTGSQVVISGSGFGASQGNSVVLLNDSAVTINSWSATSISITIPTGVTSGPLVVSVAPSMNDSNAVTFRVPNSWLDQDIGTVGVAGSASSANGTFTVAGAGAGIYNTADAFHFMYQPLLGDGTMVARLVSLQGGSGFVAAGVMIRGTLDAGSVNAKTADWRTYGEIFFDVRTNNGGSTAEPGSVSATLPYWVKVSRSGSTFSSYASADGVNWVLVGTNQTITMGPTVYVGLAVTSGTTTALATATFDNVSVSSPAPPAPNFSLSASPSSVTIAQGASGTSTIAIAPQNGFNGSVSLSASSLPSGVTASFSPNPATASSTLTLTAGSTATAGTVAVTITGTSGSLTNTTAVSLTVSPVPVADFALSASPSSVTVTQGASGTSTVTVTPQNGFTGNVNLSASGLPSGVTASFSPNPATASSTLTLTASNTATTGTVNVTITGTSGSLSHTTAISLTVQAVTVLTLPSGWSDGDVGAVGVAGTANFANNVFTVKGAGAQIYGAADAFHFVYQPLSGDGTIVARLVSLQGGSGFVAAGVMIRETLNAASTNAKTADWAAYNAIYFDARTSTGGGTAEPGNISATLPYWVKVSRSGSTFSSYASTDGVSWVQVGTNQTISMAQNVYVGLAVTSGSAAALATAAFDNVSVSTVAAPAPVISSVSATSGVIGSQVVISGSGFGASQGNSVVLLNDSAVTINSWSATSISITIPTGVTSGPLVVSMAPSMNDSNAVTFRVPNSWLDQDIGTVGVAGSASSANGTFTVAGAGAGIYNTADAFHFMYQPLLGDGTMVARLVSLQGGSGFVAAGVMIRGTLDAGSVNAKTADWRTYGEIFFDLRANNGGSTAEPGGVSATLPYWVKVSRSGSTFSSYSSADGVSWVLVGTNQTITMGPTVYVGLAVTSGTTTALATATFDNVSVTNP